MYRFAVSYNHVRLIVSLNLKAEAHTRDQSGGGSAREFRSEPSLYTSQPQEDRNETLTMNPEYDYLFKLLLIGDSGAGKSCWLLRFADDSYMDSYISTIGVDFLNRTEKRSNSRFGTQQAKSVSGLSPVASTEYVLSLPHTQNNHLLVNIRPILLFHHHWLFLKVVSTETAQAFADELGIPFLETSAKNATNVEEAFIMASQPAGGAKPPTVNIRGQPVNQQSGCCSS
ncbi:Ras-related protein RABD2b [Raphanus sativus]|nr:Ras-related protein RABD2b [Raphanus sativus]